MAASIFRDFRKVDGISFPFEIDSETVGTPYKQKIIFEKIEVNVPEDDVIFGKPSSPADKPKP